LPIKLLNQDHVGMLQYSSLSYCNPVIYNVMLLMIYDKQTAGYI